MGAMSGMAIGFEREQRATKRRKATQQLEDRGFMNASTAAGQAVAGAMGTKKKKTGAGTAAQATTAAVRPLGGGFLSY